MSEKTIESVASTIKTLQLEIADLNSKSSATAAKIKQFETELEEYKAQRDELELTKSKAPELLINGGMTDDEFDRNKRLLADLYQKIDDTAERIEIYQKTLDRDLTRKSVELNKNLRENKSILLKLYSDKLAAEIIEKQADKLKQLTAILEGRDGNTLHQNYIPGHFLGISIAAALFGEKNGNIAPQSAAERDKLIKETFESLGV
ncbi:MAG: hypothetical protein ACR65R_19885 [Methylomicrobium sp.]